jgi:hypothetical protein
VLLYSLHCFIVLCAVLFPNKFSISMLLATLCIGQQSRYSRLSRPIPISTFEVYTCSPFRDPWLGLLYHCNDRNEAFISIWRIEPKFDEQFSNQICQITKGFKNAAGTLCFMFLVLPVRADAVGLCWLKKLVCLTSVTYRLKTSGTTGVAPPFECGLMLAGGLKL